MPMNMNTRNATSRMMASKIPGLVDLRLVAESKRGLRRLTQPQALDHEQQRDAAGDRNRQVGDPHRELREFGDGVLPRGLHQQHAPPDHEQSDNAQSARG